MRRSMSRSCRVTACRSEPNGAKISPGRDYAPTGTTVVAVHQQVTTCASLRVRLCACVAQNASRWAAGRRRGWKGEERERHGSEHRGEVCESLRAKGRAERRRGVPLCRATQGNWIRTVDNKWLPLTVRGYGRCARACPYACGCVRAHRWVPVSHCLPCGAPVTVRPLGGARRNAPRMCAAGEVLRQLPERKSSAVYFEEGGDGRPVLAGREAPRCAATGANRCPYSKVTVHPRVDHLRVHPRVDRLRERPPRAIRQTVACGGGVRFFSRSVRPDLDSLHILRLETCAARAAPHRSGAGGEAAAWCW